MRQDTLIVMALVAMLCGCAATREASAPPDARALEHVLEEWTLAWSSGDVARVLAAGFLRQVGLQVSARPNPSAQDALAKQDLAHP